MPPLDPNRSFFDSRTHYGGSGRGLPRASGIPRLAHPSAGPLRLAFETLDLPADDQRLLVYLPAGRATEAALDRLVTPAPGLRLVPGGR
ncbi:hypothetical protein ACQP2P_13655 [Dactylosporangium sp. CA-139114]|uniref:MmyB family transcriptional regulator n=1 Tax=Dactylosporangium sp. CA-139114 TaxID=3239931 RepID=UPI003D978B6D